MNIPFWLLRLLPMWEYICPKCRKGVKQSAHQCPHCGEKFPLAIRVPPSFLKDPEKLEAYVHKHVFPRISEFERNYLTKYFTVIFSDGFESGNFSAWTGTTVSAGDALNVISTSPHHGTYYAQADLGGDGSENAFCHLTTNNSVLYTRGYFRLKTALPANGQVIYFILHRAGTTTMAIVYFDLSGSTKRLVFAYRSGASLVYVFTTFPYVLDTWYCLEIYAKIDGVAGEYSIWCNGGQITSATGIDSDDYGNITQVRLGCVYATLTVAHEVDFDCVVVADAYIGQEAPTGGVLAQVM